MFFILEMLKGTPVWVWGILCYLLWVGFKATQTQVVSLGRMALFPCLFLAMSLTKLYPLVSLYPGLGLIWLASLGSSGLLGMYHMSLYRHQIAVDQKRYWVRWPGNWGTLLLLLFIFFLNYLFGVIRAIYTDWDTIPYLMGSMVGISALPTGMLVGRFIYFLRALHQGPHTDLS